ncbi:hypothetical protein P7F88_03840 [Vibrio hannami]|uniref:hypothetical protein n=1 Tax=Vibrio hannami TaxID=2717094 RepID=UPI00240F4917|nr:hypothetical protein [Vibrio hannami]MDG3085279.1 hypothetical protein [Vibrio hannami]
MLKVKTLISASAILTLSGCVTTSTEPVTYTDTDTNYTLKLILPADMAGTPNEVTKLIGMEEIEKKRSRDTDIRTRKEVTWHFSDNRFTSDVYKCDYDTETEQEQLKDYYSYDKNGCIMDKDSGIRERYFSGQTLGTYSFTRNSETNLSVLTLSPESITSTHTSELMGMGSYDNRSRPTMVGLVNRIKRGAIDFRFEHNSPYKEDAVKAAFERKWGKQDVVFGIGTGYLAKAGEKQGRVLLEPEFSPYRNGSKVVITADVYPQVTMEGNVVTFDYASSFEDLNKDLEAVVNE